MLKEELAKAHLKKMRRKGAKRRRTDEGPAEGEGAKEGGEGKEEEEAREEVAVPENMKHLLVPEETYVSKWAEAGWLLENPLGVPTEREVYTLQSGAFGGVAHRVLLRKTK